MNRPFALKNPDLSAPAETAGSWSSLAGMRHKLFEENGCPANVLVVAEKSSDRAMIASILRRDRMNILETQTAAEALDIIAFARLDLIVLDRDMTGMDGLECCRLMKNARSSALTPLLMVTSHESVEGEIAGIQAGADSYLRKPMHPEVFRTRVRALIRHKNAIDCLEETETILFALAQAVEKRDQYTAGHCQRLAHFGVAFGMRLGLHESQLLALHRGGYLHDIGKIAIPDAILFKPGKLSPDEWALMQTHSVRGEEICRPMNSLKLVWPIIRNHHEKWDGSGYPDGLRADAIPLLARVIQMVDIYDALTSERPYKRALTTAEALAVMAHETERGWRDPELFQVFQQLPFAQLEDAFNEIVASPLGDDFALSLKNLQRHLQLAS